MISDQKLPVASFPYGTQVCEVEVDPETGEVQIVHWPRWTMSGAPSIR
jgi:CO/xanthine dehydrogenase Mo-binding subunit